MRLRTILAAPTSFGCALVNASSFETTRQRMEKLWEAEKGEPGFFPTLHSRFRRGFKGMSEELGQGDSEDS